MRHAARLGRQANPDLHLGRLRRARRRPGVDPLLRRGRARLRVLLAVPGAGRPARGGPLGSGRLDGARRPDARQPGRALRHRSDEEGRSTPVSKPPPQTRSPRLVTALARASSTTGHTGPARLLDHRTHGASAAPLNPPRTASPRASARRRRARCSARGRRRREHLRRHRQELSMSRGLGAVRLQRGALAVEVRRDVDPPGDLVLGGARAGCRRPSGPRGRSRHVQVHAARPSLLELPHQLGAVHRRLEQPRSYAARAAAAGGRGGGPSRGRGGRSRRASRSRPGRRPPPRPPRRPACVPPRRGRPGGRTPRASFCSHPVIPESAYPSQTMRASPRAAADASASRRR